MVASIHIDRTTHTHTHTRAKQWHIKTVNHKVWKLGKTCSCPTVSWCDKWGTTFMRGWSDCRQIACWSVPPFFCLVSDWYFKMHRRALVTRFLGGYYCCLHIFWLQKPGELLAFIFGIGYESWDRAGGRHTANWITCSTRRVEKVPLKPGRFCSVWS